MQRRNFIRSAVSALPLVLAEPLAHALQAQTPPARPTPVVAAGEDRFGESHAPGYSEILFKTSSHETPSLFAIEHSNLTPGWGPPLHLHLTQDEWFYVIEGEVLIQIGDRRVRLKAGDSVLGPRMVPHAFAAVGPKAARMLITFTPAGQMEQFFRDTAGVGPQQAAAVYSRYGMNRLGPPISQS
jgi:mannose-6-phosphate isomerase-like protein (cupin superfamily)